LIGDNKTIVGAAYFERREGAGLVCSDQSLVPRARAYEDAVVEVDWLGTGAMLVHRRVFEDIAKTYPDIDGNFFHPIDGKTGEDISFCIRAKKAGHQTHIDLSVPTFHLGYKTY
jgi:GT2 family glycosyltransferase